MAQDLKKLKEAILYISRQSVDDPTFGATNLNKMLFAADMRFYFAYGRSITGADYMKLARGPAPRQLVPVRDCMVKSGELRIDIVPCGEYTQKRTVAIRDPDTSVFDADELAVLDAAIVMLRGHYAKTVSEWSHGFKGWQIADEGENIPYAACLIDNAPLTDDDIAWGKQLAQVA